METTTREPTASSIDPTTDSSPSTVIKQDVPPTNTEETQGNHHNGSVSEPELMYEDIDEEEEQIKVNGGVDDDDDDDLEDDFKEMENATKAPVGGKKKKNNSNDVAAAAAAAAAAATAATTHVDDSTANLSNGEADDNGGHQCKWDDCNLKFAELHELVHHLNSTHVAQKKDKSFPGNLSQQSIVQLNSSAGFNPKPELVQYICKWENCPRRGSPQHSRFALIAHIRTHTGEKPFYCLVPECLKSFPRSDSLLKHLKTVHDIESNNLNDALELINSKLVDNKITTERLANFKFIDKMQPDFDDETLWVDRYKSLIRNYSTENLLKLFEINDNTMNANLKRSIIDQANKSQNAFKRQKSKISVDDIYNDESVINGDGENDSTKNGSAIDSVENQLTTDILKKNAEELEKYYAKLVSLGKVIDREVETQLEQRRHAWMKTQILLDSILKEHNLL